LDLKEFAAALLRRWYFTVAVVVVSVMAGVAIAQLVGARYSAVATTVLIPPQSKVSSATQKTDYAPPNPLLYMSGLSQARDLLVRAMGAEQVAEEFQSGIPSGTYQVTPDPVSSSPSVVVTVEAKSPEQALAGLDLLIHRIPTTLAAIQQQVGVGSDDAITTLSLTTDTKPEVNRKAQVQAAIVATAFALLMGFLALGYFDGAAMGHPRRHRRLGPAPGPPGGPASNSQTLTRRSLRAQRSEGKHLLGDARAPLNGELTRHGESRTEPVGSSRR